MESTTRSFLIGLGVLLIVVLSLSALVGGMMGPGFVGWDQTGRGSFGPGMMHGWMRGPGMGLGGLAMLAFWGVVIVGLFLLLQSVGGASGSQRQSTPLDVLKRRYAAGEVTREQFEQMRKDLE